MSDGWVKAAERSALADGEVIGVVVEGREIALYDIEGDGLRHRRHLHPRLRQIVRRLVRQGEIECPLHAGRFDARTGKATAPPCVDDLKTYPVRVEGGEIQVKLD